MTTLPIIRNDVTKDDLWRESDELHREIKQAKTQQLRDFLHLQRMLAHEEIDRMEDQP